MWTIILLMALQGQFTTIPAAPYDGIRLWRDTSGDVMAMDRKGNKVNVSEELRKEPMDVPAAEGGWTCADKSIVLLTSEDSKKHCVSFAASGH